MNVDLTVQECEATLAAIVRLKFTDPVNVPEPYFGSPFLAATASKLLQAVISECDRTGDRQRATAWRRWARWSNRTFEPPLVVRHVASAAHWATWTRNERTFYLDACTAPFVLTEEDTAALISAIDAERSRPNNDRAPA